MNHRSKNEKLLKSFTKYCDEHPEERFWQALRNWSGADFIMYWEAEEFNFTQAKTMGLQDTFYWESNKILNEN